jgi:hypothetical protein
MVRSKTTPQIGLGIVRQDKETWRACALRYGAAHGLGFEIAQSFQDYKKCGDSDADAAWAACLDWDVADLFRDGVRIKPKLQQA